MDHNEAMRKFERLMEAEASHAHNAATQLEALVLLLPSEKSRQLIFQKSLLLGRPSLECQACRSSIAPLLARRRKLEAG